MSTIDRVRYAHLKAQRTFFGVPLLDGRKAFELHDTHGLPLDVIRMEARRNGSLVDEWGLRLSMYLAGANVPKPVVGMIPRRAEDEGS